MVTLEEAKNYLRVEHSEDDALIESLMLTASQMVMDVGRVTAERYEQEEACHTATLYAVAYLYTHREEANHNMPVADAAGNALCAAGGSDLIWQYLLLNAISALPYSAMKRR